VTWAGAAFLTVYGLIALRRAWKPEAMRAAKDGGGSLAGAVAACLSFTFLNPHVYLDTVVLLGGISGGYAGADRLAFGIGAVAASFVWFFALGYGARLLEPLFAKPSAWRVLDLLIASVMFALAYQPAAPVSARPERNQAPDPAIPSPWSVGQDRQARRT
jgi:L-lysine exporter family protein LysE/ArgO